MTYSEAARKEHGPAFYNIWLKGWKDYEQNKNEPPERIGTRGARAYRDGQKQRGSINGCLVGMLTETAIHN